MHGPLVAELDELQCHPMPGLLCSTPHQRLEIPQRLPHLGIYKRKGEQVLNSFFFVLFLFLFFAVTFCCFCFVCGVTDPVL